MNCLKRGKNAGGKVVANFNFRYPIGTVEITL